MKSLQLQIDIWYLYFIIKNKIKLKFHNIFFDKLENLY